jgi:hypothetical protein
MNSSPISRFRRRNTHIACRTQSTFSPNARTYGHQNTKKCLSDIAAGRRRDSRNASSNVVEEAATRRRLWATGNAYRGWPPVSGHLHAKWVTNRIVSSNASCLRRCGNSTRTQPTARAPPPRSPAPLSAPPDTATSATAHRPATRGRSRTPHRTPRRTVARTGRCPSPG